jgi:ribosomal protein S18 acetylase RimI-like enzyme
MEKLKIKAVDNPEDLILAKDLFIEYASSLGFNLCFQSFDEELKSLPGKYSPPEGNLLLAFYDEKPAGCIAMRKLEPGICGMKRLFVKPEFRGLKIGKFLAENIINDAYNKGYLKMRLDTLSTMLAARNLYTHLGFKEIAPYCYNPIEGAVYMELELKSAIE